MHCSKKCTLMHCSKKCTLVALQIWLGEHRVLGPSPVRRSPLKAGRSVLCPDGKVMAHGTTAVLVLGNVK